MKRFLVLGILGLFMISMMAGVMGEETAKEIGTALGTEARGFGEGIRAFFVGLFGDADSKGGKGWLSKVFFAVLLGMIIYTTISSFFPGSNFIQWGITIAITTIAMIGIPPGYLEALMVSYGAMGLTILTVIPFLVMVIFTVKVKDLMIAKGTWAFYVFYYFFLIIGQWWNVRVANTVATAVSTAPYWIAFLGGIAMFFTIPYVRHWFDDAKLGTYVETAETAIKKETETHKLSKKSHEGTVEAATS